MPAQSDGGGKGVKVEVFRLVNHLKAKLGMRFRDQEGGGFLAPEAIAEADGLIAALCAECPKTISGHLEKLSSLWLKMRDMKQSPERDEISSQVFTLAHEIKDVGSMCGFDIVAYFAESLRDYIARTELSLEAQRVIIQAHVDAIQAVNRLGLRKEGGAEAEELKKVVKIAIGRYS